MRREAPAEMVRDGKGEAGKGCSPHTLSRIPAAPQIV
jgi:hypothetical protein